MATQTLTNVYTLQASTYQTVEDAAVFLRTDCSSLLKGSGSAHMCTRTCAHWGLMRSGIASGLAFVLPSLAVAALIIFIYAFSTAEGRREREMGEMREAWIQLLLCIHSPTSSWIPLTGVRDAAVFLCKFRVEYVFLLSTRVFIIESHQSSGLHTVFFGLVFFFSFF